MKVHASVPRFFLWSMQGRLNNSKGHFETLHQSLHALHFTLVRYSPCVDVAEDNETRIPYGKDSVAGRSRRALKSARNGICILGGGCSCRSRSVCRAVGLPESDCLDHPQSRPSNSFPFNFQTLHYNMQ
jgi:hypothetical protein